MMGDMQELDNLITRLVDEDQLSHADVKSVEDKLKTSLQQKAVQDPNYVPKEWVKAPFAITAYIYILENGCTADEAFNHALEVHGKDEDWLKDAKNYKFYYAKDVVKAHDDHPKQKGMVRRKTMNKKALRESNTVNQQMRTLADGVSVDNQLQQLRESDAKQQAEIDILNARVRLIEETQNLSSKDLALAMHKQGIAQKLIAAHLGVTTRTIRNWVKPQIE